MYVISDDTNKAIAEQEYNITLGSIKNATGKLFNLEAITLVNSHISGPELIDRASD